MSASFNQIQCLIDEMVRLIEVAIRVRHFIMAAVNEDRSKVYLVLQNCHIYQSIQCLIHPRVNLIDSVFMEALKYLCSSQVLDAGISLLSQFANPEVLLNSEA